MKHIYFFLFSSLFYSTLFSAGFTGDTLVLTQEGQLFLEQIQATHTIAGQDNVLQKVTNLHKYVVTQAICIQIADDFITCHKDQLFWCVNRNSWQKASSLHQDDAFLTFDHRIIPIINVTTLQKQTVLYAVSVTKPHLLFVGKYMVLAHNFPFVPAIVAGITVCFGSGVKIIGTLSAGIAVCGAFIGLTWGKKNKERITCTPTCGFGSDQVPLFNYADQQHPHGIYIDSPKHTASKRGNISPRPKNGQKALDNSVQIKGTSHRRIGISEGEFVILNRTSERVYHGHVESWEEFGKKLQKFLQKIGWVSSKGKILCKEK